MRCLLKHKWSRKTFDGSAYFVRTCRKCGTVQRGIYGTWETLREYAYVKSEQLQVVRQPSSRSGQLAHTLGLYRTRVSDKGSQDAAPEQGLVNSLGSDFRGATSFVRASTGQGDTNQLETPDSNDTPTDRRRRQRINIALPVILENASGVTRDVTAGGAYFWTNGTFTVGQPICFTLERNTVPTETISRCRGYVLRTELHRDHLMGVATSIIESSIGSA